MRIRLIGLAVGALGTLAFACSSSPPNPYATPSEYCAAYAKAICQIGTTTCQFDVSGCETYQSAQCTAAIPSSSTRQYTSSKVQACIDQLNSAYGGGPSTITAAQLNTISTVCGQVFPGTAGEGAACQTNADCTVSGNICASAPGQSPVCANPTPKNLNDACADPGDQCPTAAYCQPQTTGTSKCVTAATAGQACSAPPATSTSAPLCDANDRCVGGTCQALSATGDPCSTSADCAPGLFCDTYTDSVTPYPACVTAYTFARGAVDCLGIEGQGTNGMAPEGGTPEGGGGSEGGSEGGTDGGSNG